MAAVIGEFGVQLLDDGTVRHVGFRAEEAAQHSAAVQAVTTGIPGSVVVEDPWGTQQATTVTQVAAPACAHGPLKAVPGGIAGPNARNPGKAYAAFWACQAPQGAPKCQLDRSKLPPVPVASDRPPF